MEEQPNQLNAWSRNFIIISDKQDLVVTQTQISALKRKFKAKKIKIRKNEEQTKIFLNRCGTCPQIRHVQNSARQILKDQQLMVTKLTRSDVSNLSPYDTQDSNSQSHEEDTVVEERQHHSVSNINSNLESTLQQTSLETNLTQIIFENKISDEDELEDTLTNLKMFKELNLFLNNTVKYRQWLDKNAAKKQKKEIKDNQSNNSFFEQQSQNIFMNQNQSEKKVNSASMQLEQQQQIIALNESENQQIVEESQQKQNIVEEHDNKVKEKKQEKEEAQNNSVNVLEIQQQPQNMLQENQEIQNQNSSYDEELERLTPIKFQNKRIKKSFQKHVKKIRGEPSNKNNRQNDNNDKSKAKKQKTTRVNQFEQAQARLLKDIVDRNEKQQK